MKVYVVEFHTQTYFSLTAPPTFASTYEILNLCDILFRFASYSEMVIYYNIYRLYNCLFHGCIVPFRELMKFYLETKKS